VRYFDIFECNGQLIIEIAERRSYFVGAALNLRGDQAEKLVIVLRVAESDIDDGIHGIGAADGPEIDAEPLSVALL
jgi:hypothetical protein